MQKERFAELLQYRLESIEKILGKKAKQYAMGDDRLQNFKDGAQFNNTIPEDYLMHLVSKHIIALRDFIRVLKYGERKSIEDWDEKIGDIINYMILLEALIWEGEDDGKK